MPLTVPPELTTSTAVLRGAELTRRLPHLTGYVMRSGVVAPSHHPAWLTILKEGLDHVPFAVEARTPAGGTAGFVALSYVRSTLFGRFLVSLPYLNTGGIHADSPAVARRLIDAAVKLARELRVKHLELRHEAPLDHPAFNAARTDKVHMRLALPSFPGPLWTELPAKVRNQVRKGEKSNLKVQWGGAELLDEFYAIFSANMRDLGTPVYSRNLFAAILRHLGGDAELCLTRLEGQAVAGALLLHGRGVTEVPSASCLREHNATCANMMMYWNLLDRAIQRGSDVFDFGRSTTGGNTYKFKKQWGAEPEPAVWQYYHLNGSPANLRPDNPRYGRFVRMWKRLPLPVTRAVGPRIVRGIP